MPKPRKVRPGKLGLSKAVKKALEEHGGKALEHRFVEPVAAEHLLEKLKLPGEKLSKAKKMAAHSVRLLEANARTEKRLPITVKSVRKIIEIVLDELPSFVERHKSQFSEQQSRSIETLQKNLEVDLVKMKTWADHLPSGLSPTFIEDARNIHFDEMRHLMGERKFKAYMNAMRRTTRILAKRKG